MPLGTSTSFLDQVTGNRKIREQTIVRTHVHHHRVKSQNSRSSIKRDRRKEMLTAGRTDISTLFYKVISEKLPYRISKLPRREMK